MRRERYEQTNTKFSVDLFYRNICCSFACCMGKHTCTHNGKQEFAELIKKLYSTKPQLWHQYPLSAGFQGLIMQLEQKLENTKQVLFPILFIPEANSLSSTPPSTVKLCQGFICNTIPRSAEWWVWYRMWSNLTGLILSILPFHPGFEHLNQTLYPSRSSL